MEDNSFDDATPGNKKWYEEFPKGEAPYKHSKSEVEVLNLKSEAKKHLENDVTSFQLKQSKSKKSKLTWLKTALTRGTSADKVAASIVLIQNSPKHNLARLISLISQIRASKHNQAITVITALRDLFLSDLLHPRYRLLKFEEQNLDELDNLNLSNGLYKHSSNISKNKLLAHWYFEDQLKEQYERFVLSLSSIASDTVDKNRQKAVSVMTELLMTNAEQGQKLLELLINKMGDPNSKVASKTVFCLIKLVREQPYMKFIVLQEVEKLLFRKNLAQRAQYYSICLLTQFVLGRNDKEIATHLIDIYFAFFKACLKRGEPDSRMMAAILTGVNRAYLFADTEMDKVQEHIHSVYKVVHIGSFNVALNALNLLYQVINKDPAQSNRFYSAFYRKLMDPQLGTANRRTVFLNLLFRVLRNDPNTRRCYAVIKRILQVTLYFPACMTCATLYIVSKILHIRTDINSLITNIQSNFEIKKENDLHESAKISEINLESDKTDDIEIEIGTRSEDDTIFLSNITAGPIKEDPVNKDLIEEYKIEDSRVKDYDPFGRNPLCAGAHKSFCVELIALSRHYHPSVALFATMILEGKPIIYNGDPLEDLSLIRFLDRYVFKNPKKLESKRIVKKNDPLAQRAAYAPKGVRSVPVGSAAYLNEREDRIPVDELFLYRYLKNKQLRFQYEKNDEEDDNESINSEEFNTLLDKFSKDKDVNFDIAADIEFTKSKKKGAFTELNDDDSEDDEDDDEVNDDENTDEEFEDDIIDDDEDLMGMNDEMEGISDEDLSVMDFNDDDDDEFENDILTDSIKRKNKTANKKGSKSVFKTKRGKGRDLDSVFVAAEEFAEILEEQGRSKYKHGGTNVLSDVDGASVKQLDWEMKRNQRLAGTRDGKKRKNIDRFKNNKSTKRFKR